MSRLPPLLLIDHHPEQRSLVSLVIRGAFGRSEITGIGDSAALTRALLSVEFGLVLCASRLPWIDSAELIDLIHERLPDAAVIVMGGDANDAVPTEVLQRGIDAVLHTDAAGLSRIENCMRSALRNAQRRSRGGGKSARADQDLQEMAHVVSHDLQQPLGVICRSIELLEEEAWESLSDQAREYLTHARRGSEALERRLHAIVGYSRVDTRGGEFANVDLRQVVDRVLGLLEEQLAATAAEVNVDSLPRVWADEGQMEQLFQNLLSNAIKFCGSAPPQIHITAAEAQGSWRLSVSDQGIGIDPGATDRVFLMFQRLHTEAEIPGTGVGLAVCRRIMARHGGRIWVESRPGEGSTFHFTLPAARDGVEGESERVGTWPNEPK